ncbi:hypothetical protein Vafri_1971 [Volvox africanus]|nr:hypothetical protein Vafri_1971 [Volvox africanus]
MGRAHLSIYHPLTQRRHCRHHCRRRYNDFRGHHHHCRHHHHHCRHHHHHCRLLLTPNKNARFVPRSWRSVYESCSKASELQALVGECYAREAVFEDALVSARGQESVYRQFAILGAAVRSVQVNAYSLSVAPLGRPQVRLEPPRGAEFAPEAQATALIPSKVLPLQHLAQPQPQRPSMTPQRPQPQTQFQRVGLQEISILSRQQQQQQQQQREQESEVAVQRQQVQLHLTRVTVENVQRFELGLPPWLTWLVGGKARGLQVGRTAVTERVTVAWRQLGLTRETW